ncbi:MAG: hypothetical protein E6Q84_01030 [Thiothrix sp.]|nr:MAG: hypothetical protein E6Q84_01030 [Thiothrix sp.]
MQLPAFFGRKKVINLLPRDKFESSGLGYVLMWLLAFGKWAVIVTQLIVMGTFLWRFGLDRKLTDVKKSSAKYAAIVKSYDQLERDFLTAQKKLSAASEIVKSQENIQSEFASLASYTPIDVWYEKLSVGRESTSVTGYAKSLQGFGKFLGKVSEDKRYSGVSINKIQDGGAGGALLQFELTLSKNQPKKEGK